MQEDANFDLAILADQAVRAEMSTPPLSMPDVKHIAIHDRGDVERRPKRTLDFNSLASGPTTTNVAEDVGAAVTMDIDTEPPTQAAARSSSSDVPSNERADWLNNGPARARRAVVVSTARVAREVRADAGENVPLIPDDDYDDRHYLVAGLPHGRTLWRRGSRSVVYPKFASVPQEGGWCRDGNRYSWIMLDT